MNKKHSILLVEDDEDLGYVLKEYLALFEFDVTWAKNGVEGWQRFQEGAPQVCLLDVMLPQMDGFSLARKIKESGSQVPFIFLTAKALKVDKLKGFSIGADDYMVKPIEEEELLARLRVIIRRSLAQPEPPASPTTHGTHSLGQYTLDVPNQTLAYASAEPVRLTEKECQLLQMFCLRPNQLITREEVLSSLWGKNDYFNRRSMDVFISRLRKYLAADPQLKIVTVYKKGFVMEVR